MTDCLFCKISAGEIPAHKVHENEHVLAFLDIGPVSPGHTLVISKAHAENLAVNTVEDAQALITAVHFLAPKIMQAVGADGYNLGMNHGESAGQDVMHTHLHIMPRKAGVPRTFTKTHPSDQELATIAMEIQARI
ncbi:MAG: HIT family protein [Patescibacteria group bacterium]